MRMEGREEEEGKSHSCPSWRGETILYLERVEKKTIREREPWYQSKVLEL